MHWATTHQLWPSIVSSTIIYKSFIFQPFSYNAKFFCWQFVLAIYKFDCILNIPCHNLWNIGTSWYDPWQLCLQWCWAQPLNAFPHSLSKASAPVRKYCYHKLRAICIITSIKHSCFIKNLVNFYFCFSLEIFVFCLFYQHHPTTNCILKLNLK